MLNKFKSASKCNSGLETEDGRGLTTLSCAFTGHREIEEQHSKTLRMLTKQAVKSRYNEGVANFISGMASGFDMLAAEVVLELREECPGISLTAVVPFRGQDDRFSLSDKQRYSQILEEADEVIVLSEHYNKKAFYYRNLWMVDHADCMIAYFNGIHRGGTYFTFHTAQGRGLPVVNLYNL